MKVLKQVFSEIICWFKGHKYKEKRVINAAIRELVCSRCSQEFGINHDMKTILPLDYELIELHNDIVRNRQVKL